MGKLTGLMAGPVLMAGMGVAAAAEAPQILGAADYQAMSTSEMASITGERRNVNRNNNTNIAQAQGCGSVAAQNCAQAIGGDALAGVTIIIGGPVLTMTQ